MQTIKKKTDCGRTLMMFTVAVQLYHYFKYHKERLGKNEAHKCNEVVLLIKVIP